MSESSDAGRGAGSPAGPRGAGWRPSSSVEPAPDAPPAHADREEPREQEFLADVSRRGRVRGQARAVKQRTERYGKSSKEVISFRIERYDSAGNRLQPVGVELRGYGFQGSVNDGDWVEVAGRSRDGTFVARRIDNLTTNAIVRARSYTKQVVAALAVVVVLIAGAVVLVSSGQRSFQDRQRDSQRQFQRQVERNRQDFERNAQESRRQFCDQARASGFTPPGCPQ
jgi:hypothetical protein